MTLSMAVMAMSKSPAMRRVSWTTEFGVGVSVISRPSRAKKPRACAVQSGQLKPPGKTITWSGESCIMPDVCAGGAPPCPLTVGRLGPRPASTGSASSSSTRPRAFVRGRHRRFHTLPMGPIVVHAHYIPPGFLEAVGREPARYGVGLERASDGRMRFLFPGQDGTRPIPPGLLDLQQRVKALDAAGIRHQVVATWMDAVGYALPAEQGARWSRGYNESLAEALRATAAPGRFSGAATGPLQDGARAAAELGHAGQALGLAPCRSERTCWAGTSTRRASIPSGKRRRR